MTKTLTGNELPSNRDRLNPKIFVRQRRMEFVGTSLTDSETDVSSTIGDFLKEKVTDSFYTEKKLKPKEFVSLNASLYNLINNKESVSMAYFREGYDESRSINTDFIINLDYLLSPTGSIIVNGILKFIPFNKEISPHRNGKLYEEYCKFHNVELDPYKIYDSLSRPNYEYKINLSLEKTKEDNTIYKGEYSGIFSSKDERLKYNLRLLFSYNECTDEMNVEIANYSLDGLLLSVTNPFIFDYTSTTNYKLKTYNYDLSDLHELKTHIKIPIDPKCTHFIFNSSCPSILNLSDENLTYEEKDVIMFYQGDNFSVRYLTHNERNGKTPIQLPKGTTHISYFYEGSNKDNQKLLLRILLGITYEFYGLKKDNHEMKFIICNLINRQYNLLDSFGFVVNPNCSNIILRNIKETDITIKMMSFKADVDYTETITKQKYFENEKL